MKNMEKKYPDDVLEKLSAYAERMKIKVGEAANQFKDWLSKEFAVDNPLDEDEYLLNEWAEMFVIETRNLGGSSSGGRETKTYVGHFVGLDDSIVDLRKNMRERAVSLFRNNPDKAVNDGFLGILSAKEGLWHLNGNPTSEKVEGGNLPWFGMEVDDRIVALLSQNDNNKGRPVAPESKVRNLYLLGNSVESFNNSIEVFRIQLTGDLMQGSYDFGRPVKCQVIEPNKSDFDTVYTNRDFAKTLEYSDDFVGEEDRIGLRPERFLLSDSIHEYHTDLSDLVEVFESKKKPLSNGTGYYGPMIITKGNVSGLNKEPLDSQWDQTGQSYRLSVTGVSLQNKYGKDSVQSEITVWIPGRVKEDCHPFEFKDEYGEWKPYAEKTPIIIFGKLKLRPYKDDNVPSITALGVYVPPRTARPGATGGDTSISQFRGEN